MAERFEDPSHPPRNRADTALGVLDLQIVDGEQVHTLDPNGAIMAAVQGTLPLNGPTVDSSVLSGAPALIWREDDLAIPLAPEEIDRLVRRALAPDEVKRLRELYGLFFSIHADFYEPDSGIAVQPITR